MAQRLIEALRQELSTWLAARQARGYNIHFAKVELPNFISLLEENRARHITEELALRWAASPDIAPSTRYNRFMAVRGFAKHMRTIDPRTEIPPPGSVPPAQRIQPYVFSLAEIRRLLSAARESGGTGSLNRWTYPTLFGLLAVTGLRVGEALRLGRKDVDLRRGVVGVRGAKFGKNRLVPVHWTTKRALLAYCQRRDANALCAGSHLFFVSPHGRHLRYSTVLRDFHRLSQACGFAPGRSGRLPRIHDLRHTFVVCALERVYRSGGDVQALLPVLATYLGHDRLVSTYWYFSAAPELMGPIVQRLERRWEVKDR